MKQERIGRLAEAMRASGIGQTLITGDLSLYYYTGQYEQSMERLRALLVDASGACRYYANALFAPLDSETHCHPDGAEREALQEIAGQLTASGGKTAIDRQWQAGYLLDLLDFAPGARLISAGDLLSVPMRCKDAEEQSLLRRSSRINDEVVAELIASIRPDSTERTLSGSIHALYDRHGADGYAGGALVAFGANSANPHPQSRDVHPAEGDSILIDAGAPYCRYESDMTRTVFFRDVSRKMEKVYAVVLEANLAGIAAVRPGRTAAEVDRACRDVIEKSGYGEFFTHRTGHGIGLHLHEEPYIAAGSETVLEEGMVFSVEPGIYLPQAGGVRIEDLVLVTANGAEVLNRLPKTLQVVE